MKSLLIITALTLGAVLLWHGVRRIVASDFYQTAGHSRKNRYKL